MATDSAPYPDPRLPRSHGQGLKKGAIGYLSNIVIGVRVDGARVLAGCDARLHRRGQGRRRACPGGAARGVPADAARRLGYKYFKPRRPDAGTTFAWVTRAFGPSAGWLNGWAIFLADLIVMASLADMRRDLHLSAVRPSQNSANRKWRSSSPRCCGSRS